MICFSLSKYALTCLTRRGKGKFNMYCSMTMKARACDISRICRLREKKEKRNPHKFSDLVLSHSWKKITRIYTDIYISGGVCVKIFLKQLHLRLFYCLLLELINFLGIWLSGADPIRSDPGFVKAFCLLIDLD